MTKEDRQIIDRAVKEHWRIGDRSCLKRLLKKNLEQYRENVELERKLEQAEKENAELKEKYNRVDIIGYDALKNLTEAKEIIKDLLRLPYANDWEVCGDVTSYLDKAEQFLKEIEK